MAIKNPTLFLFLKSYISYLSYNSRLMLICLELSIYTNKGGYQHVLPFANSIEANRFGSNHASKYDFKACRTSSL